MRVGCAVSPERVKLGKSVNGGNAIGPKAPVMPAEALRNSASALLYCRLRRDRAMR